MAFDKKIIVCKLGDFRKARSMYTQNNALTGKNRATTVHRGSLAFIVQDMIIEELSIASVRINRLKPVDV